MIACTSSRDRNPTSGRVQRFIGMARVRWIMASASGSFHAANRRNDRTAASRALRLRMELFRSFSR